MQCSSAEASALPNSHLGQERLRAKKSGSKQKLKVPLDLMTFTQRGSKGGWVPLPKPALEPCCVRRHVMATATQSRAEQKLALILGDCGLDKYLDSRAIYAVSKTLWQQGYVCGRSQQERLADLVVRRLGIGGPAPHRIAVRERVIAKVVNGHLSLPETLEFMTWAKKANRAKSITDALRISPVTAERRRQILAHLFELSFSITMDEAYQNMAWLQTRDRKSIKDTAVVAVEAAGRSIYAFGYGSFMVSSGLISLMVGGGLLLTGFSTPGTPFLIPFGVVPFAAGGAGVWVGLVSFVSASRIGVIGAWHVGQRLWQHRLEIGPMSSRDAAILSVLSSLNERAADPERSLDRRPSVEPPPPTATLLGAPAFAAAAG